MTNAGVLPPYRDRTEGLVGSYLNDALTGLPPITIQQLRGYNPRLKLDFVAPPSIGVSAGGPFGSGVVGGIGMFFSDMLGDHSMTVVAQANGTFKDIGAQVFYLNRAHRFNYGAGAGHIPILFVQSYYGGTVSNEETGIPEEILIQRKQRIFIDQLQGVASYPFTQSRRFEVTAGATRYGFDFEEDWYIFSPFGIRRERVDRPELEPDPVYFVSGGVSLVTDFSFFGFTSPVKGGRSRFEISPFVGTTTFIRALVDYRRYFGIGQSTFAVRGIHVGNYGTGRGDATDQLFMDEYLGYANSRGFVRGYSFYSFDDFAECTPDPEGYCSELTRLQGTRIGIASAELRFPLLGNDRFGLLNFPYLPTEISVWVDAGVAWTADELPVWKFDRTSTERVPVFSTGVSTRFNLFGYTVLEIFYAKPYQRPGKGAHFGFQIVPGW